MLLQLSRKRPFYFLKIYQNIELINWYVGYEYFFGSEQLPNFKQCECLCGLKLSQFVEVLHSVIISNDIFTDVAQHSSLRLNIRAHISHITHWFYTQGWIWALTGPWIIEFGTPSLRMFANPTISIKKSPIEFKNISPNRGVQIF